MFQLIVAVIAIALVVVLAIAALYFGGIAFTSGSEKALYAQYTNEGVQISSAIKVYEAQTGVPTSRFNDAPTGTGTGHLTNAAGETIYDPTYNFQMLVTTELLKDKNLQNSAWIIEKGEVRKRIDMSGMVAAEQLRRCSLFNGYAGKDISDAKLGAGAQGCPPCSNEAFKDYPACQLPTT
jgi:hypothetical protein